MKQKKMSIWSILIGAVEKTKGLSSPYLLLSLLTVISAVSIAGADPAHTIAGGWEPSGALNHLDLANPRYCFWFDAAVGETVTFEAELVSNSDSYLYLLDMYGAIIIAADDNSGTGTNAKITYSTSAEGKFQLVCATTSADVTDDFELNITPLTNQTTHVSPCFQAFELEQYGGAVTRFYEWGPDAFTNDTHSSLRVPKGVWVRAYKDSDLKGTARTYHSDIPELQGGMNDTYSSYDWGFFNYNDYFVAIYSDPQVEWLHKDEARPDIEMRAWEKTLLDNGLTDETISEMYNMNVSGAINDIISNVGQQQFGGIIINGDLTEFGDQDGKLDKFISYCITPANANVYPGLGNHDYENNVDDCWRNNCAGDMIHWMRGYVETLPTVGYYDYSLAYSWQIGDIYYIQLHNYPGYTTSFTHKTHNCGVTSSFPWLGGEVAGAHSKGLKIILNTHMTSLGDHGDDIVANYNVSAIFAGHNHSLHKRRTSPPTFGDRTVYTYWSGATNYGTFLLARMVRDKMYVYRMKVDHRMNGLLTIIDSANVSHEVKFSLNPFNIDSQAGPTYYSYVQNLYPVSPPLFNTDPINKPDAIEDAAYSDTIAVDATDADFDDVLIYSKTSGLDWLEVAANGDLTGTPDDSHVGINNFDVRVTDASGFTDEATLNITVQNLYDGQWGLPDFAGFAASWLNTNCGLCNGADLDGDNDVTINDLRILGEIWLTTGSD